MSSVTLDAVLKQIPLFSSLPTREIQKLLDSMAEVDLEAGQMLLHEGDRSDRFYVLIEGQLEIIKALGTSDEKLLALRDPGAFIGDMSLFSSEGQRTASVRARTHAHLLEMTNQAFSALLHSQPSIAQEMIRTLSARLDEAENHTIRDLREKNQMLREAYEALQAAQAQIIEKEKMEAELEVARHIQHSILPDEKPQRPGFEFGSLLQSMRGVGGDFYDFIHLSNDHLAIVIGDVTDHGVPAALFMALTFSLLRAEAGRTNSPAEALQAVNRHLLEINKSGMFVTILFCLLDCQGATLRSVRAGHHPPLVLDAERRINMTNMGVGQPLGLVPGMLLDEQEMKLEPEAMVVLYTDGVTEAKDADGNDFGVEGIQRVLQASPSLSAQEACEQIYKAVNAFCQNEPQGDDITILAIRKNGQ
jgi:serine phosphatase RsbU (regulator of sigma subunit)